MGPTGGPLVDLGWKVSIIKLAVHLNICAICTLAGGVELVHGLILRLLSKAFWHSSPKELITKSIESRYSVSPSYHHFLLFNVHPSPVRETFPFSSLSAGRKGMFGRTYWKMTVRISFCIIQSVNPKAQVSKIDIGNTRPMYNKNFSGGGPLRCDSILPYFHDPRLTSLAVGYD